MAEMSFLPGKPFLGVKERRRSSFEKALEGDALQLSSQPEVVKILSKQGDTAVRYSEMVFKVGRTGLMKERLMAVTNKSLYMLDPAPSYRIRRRIPLQAVGHVELSTLPDSFVKLAVPSEHDVLLVSQRKTEAVIVLQAGVKEVRGEALEVRFSNDITYRAAFGLLRGVAFSRGEGGQVHTAFRTITGEESEKR